MKSRKVVASLCMLAAAVSLTGCARQISPNVYSEKHVGESSRTYRGYIVSKRVVEVHGSEKLQENAAGIAVGGATGAIAGSMIGGGHGNTAATLLGAVGGAVAGAYAQKALESQEAFEYVVELKNGEMRTVVQGLEPSLNEGQRVLLMVSHDGRSRIVADQSRY